MVGQVSRRVFLGGAVSAVAGAAFANAPLRSLRPVARPGAVPAAVASAAPATVPEAAALLAEAQLGGQTAFVVVDATSGALLEAHEPGLAMPPASVAKAATALYALDTLGGGYRFATRLIATGPVNGGRLEGDLVLAGSGDPLLDTDALAALVGRLKAAGVTAVSGRFLVHAGALPQVRMIDPDQPDHVGYNPAISGLNLNFNRVHFQWQQAQQGWAVSMDARSDSLRPAVKVARMSVVSRDLPVYTYREAGGVDEWTVASGALGKAGSRWLPVRRPEAYAGEVFQVLAAAQGVTLGAPQVVARLPAGRDVARHDSAPLATLVEQMLKFSTNLTAEVLGLVATQTRGQGAGTLKASAGAMSDWLAARYGVSGARFVDHSGLGVGSRISAADLARVLVASHEVAFDRLKAIEPTRADGKADATARHVIRAKTGTLNFVSTLAGYVRTGNGRLLAFAILSADLDRRAAISKDEAERPPGGRAWAGRARGLQQGLIRRWATLYG